METSRGQLLHVEFVSNVCLVAGARGIQCNIRDVSRRFDAEQANRRLAQLYRTISRCNAALVRAVDELELSRRICKVLVEEGGIRQAWVGYITRDKDARIDPVSAVGASPGYLESLKHLYSKDYRAFGPVAEAVDSGKIVVRHDLRDDALGGLGHAQALQQGCLTVAAIPFDLGKEGRGILVVYGASPNEFTNDIVALLKEMAGDLAFGIGNLRARAEGVESLRKIDESLEQTVAAIAAVVEMRDPYTAGHQRRVAKLATAIATEMGLPENQVHGLRLGSLVHDIGKIHVPAEILSSPAKLSEAEYAIVRTHPQAGWEILKGIAFPWPIAEIVYQHHERHDGTGYPRALKGDAILLEARILGVADLVEAMSSHRPYRVSLGEYAALQELSRQKGLAFDPAVVDACVKLFMDKRFAF